MSGTYDPSPWLAVFKSGSWQIRNRDGSLVAAVESSGGEEANARLIASSPFLLEALEALMALIGDEDLPDSGERSGAAICDMARAAVELSKAGG